MAPGGPPQDDLLDSEALERLLEGSRLGHRIVALETVESTNQVARRLARAGAPDGTLVLAERQTAGRGRRGRVWASPAGLGLYASFVLRPEAPGPAYGAALQLAAGVAVAEAVAVWLPRPPELLWPNDCLADGAKLAGVLVEAESDGNGLDFLVCGIGVNVNQRATDFPAELVGVATSLRRLSGAPRSRTELLARLVRAMDAWDGAVRRGGPGAVAARWLELSPSSRGGHVELETEGGRVAGISAGLSPAGGLLVDVGGAVREIVTGELIRVRRQT